MTAPVELVVPALTLRADDDHPDWDAVRRYAERAAATPVDRFILSGSTTRGDLLSVDDRARTVEVWLEVLPPDRLLAATWGGDDVGEAKARGVPLLPVLVDLASEAEAVAFLAALPEPAFVYSHPMLSPVTFDATLAAAARARECLPAGGGSWRR